MISGPVLLYLLFAVTRPFPRVVIECGPPHITLCDVKSAQNFLGLCRYIASNLLPMAASAAVIDYAVKIRLFIHCPVASRAIGCGIESVDCFIVLTLGELLRDLPMAGSAGIDLVLKKNRTLWVGGTEHTFMGAVLVHGTWIAAMAFVTGHARLVMRRGQPVLIISVEFVIVQPKDWIIVAIDAAVAGHHAWQCY